jgi:HD-GYP domain-containing protein (c-di-GMP phosphodiesterase class II)
MLAMVAEPGSFLAQDSANDPAIRLSEVISAMSYALDVTGGQPENHAVRSCIIGLRVATELGLCSDERDALFYTLLLKDLGCSSNAARMCALFQADDRSVKQHIRLIDWTSQLTTARFSLGHANPGARFDQRLLAILGIAAKKDEASRGLIKVRCERGADITRMMGFPEQTAEAILSLDEHWNGGGQPLGLRGDAIPLLGRIASLAQTMEVFVSSDGIDAACGVAQSRSGKWFDPELVHLFRRLATCRSFQVDLTHPDPRRLLQTLEPQDNMRIIDAETYDRVALAFSKVIDAKSPWTLRHSEGVADIAVGISAEMALPSEHQAEIYRAGLLHDIGKLGVSNLVLDKKGSLSDEEFEQMRSHAMHTQKILGRVSAFRQFADYASAHHERLDGKGYHRGLAGDEVPLEARILAVADVCEALTADRPYREGMPAERALAIIREDTGSAFCPEVSEAFMQYQDRTHLFDRLKQRTVAA